MTPRSAWADTVTEATLSALSPLADSQRARPMAAYMRDRFPFLGIAAPSRRSALTRAWSSLRAPSTTELMDGTEALWDLPEREFQYAGCDLLLRWHRVLAPDVLAGPLASLITTKSWWDTVDSLRAAAVGPLVAAHPDLHGVLWRWIDADDRWLVRSAIIHQLGYKDRTDADLLFAFCARRAGDQEFFVAKAIGWALRTHARIDPGAVRDFVSAHPQLSGLARREALKHL